VPAATFDDRFQEILDLGLVWINVSVMDVRDGVLRVDVTYNASSVGGAREDTEVLPDGPMRGAWQSMGVNPDTHPAFQIPSPTHREP
jgi:hypothetical protein